MNRSVQRNGAGWNREQAVGPKTAFRIEELATLARHLKSARQEHDLCLLALGVDTMLRAGDLLSLKVSDICYRDGTIKATLRHRQQKTRRGVYPVLTGPTRHSVAQWIKVSGKRPDDWLFTSRKVASAQPISRAWYAQRVKLWAEWLGLPPEDYSTHSIRRTKPTHMYWAGESLAVISKLLGHKSEASTMEYLGITQQKAEEASLRHVMLPELGQKSGRR